MLDYFEKNMAHLTERGVQKSTIKYTMLDNGYYHKFYKDQDNVGKFLQTGNIDQLVTAINTKCDNLIEQYHTWPDIGAVYLKCKKVDFVYLLNSHELINKFPHKDLYLKYVLDNIVDFSSAIYPSCFDDWLPWNIAIQEDLSWIVVDLEEMIHKPRHHYTGDDFIQEIIYKLARAPARSDGTNYSHLDPVYIADYIRHYFHTRPNTLDFIK